MSIKQKTKALSECLDEVFKVIEELSENLDKIEAKEGHSERFARFKRFQIQRIINAVNAFEAYREETSLAYKLLADQNKNLREVVSKLEIICLMHGISDFENLLKYPKDCLLNDFIRNHKERRFQLPFAFWISSEQHEEYIKIPCHEPAFDIDKKGNKIHHEKPREEPKTTEKPVTSFKGLTFKDFNRNGEEQSKQERTTTH